MGADDHRRRRCGHAPRGADQGTAQRGGWSQAELGEKVAADSQRISRYENGRLTPSLAAAVRLAEALDVSVDYLVIEGASRRPLTDADSTLAQHLAGTRALDQADRDAVLHIIDGLIAKNRVRHALADAS